LTTKTIRVSTQTHQRLANLGKWGEPIEQVIIELLNEKKHSKEQIDAYFDYLLQLEKELDSQCEWDTKKHVTTAIEKFKETFPK
jgi:predicted CopG family antitoxin